MPIPKNRRIFEKQAATPDGVIIATMFYLSQNLIEDTKFDLQGYVVRKSEETARLWNVFHTPQCVYTYLAPEEYDYDPGPSVVYDEKMRPNPTLRQVFGRVRVTINGGA